MRRKVGSLVLNCPARCGHFQNDSRRVCNYFIQKVDFSFIPADVFHSFVQAKTYRAFRPPNSISSHQDLGELGTLSVGKKKSITGMLGFTLRPSSDSRLMVRFQQINHSVVTQTKTLSVEYSAIGKSYVC